MSREQNLSVKLLKAGYQHVEGTIQPQPMTPPPFTLTDLRNAIPPHCFKRNMLLSFGFLTLDWMIVSSLFYCAYIVLEEWTIPIYCTIFGYLIYWFVQGSIMCGIWVLGHECGHDAFSENALINDIVGLILHSAVLVPYHGFKFIHRIHHSHTGSCENDVLFVPFTKTELQNTWSEAWETSPLYNLFITIRLLLVAHPLLLGMNAWGARKYENVPNSYFNPKAIFFLPKERPLIVLSDACFLLAIATIGYFISICGFFIVVRLYIIPYLVLNAWLVTIAYLQHTDTYIPHFREGEWNWLRGSLCTVDRSYGKFLDTAFHHLNDHHVIHHIFNKIPFYNCKEATNAIKPILGKYYLKDTTPFYLALWRVINHCKYVKDDGGIVFYKRKLVE